MITWGLLFITFRADASNLTPVVSNESQVVNDPGLSGAANTAVPASSPPTPPGPATPVVAPSAIPASTAAPPVAQSTPSVGASPSVGSSASAALGPALVQSPICNADLVCNILNNPCVDHAAQASYFPVILQNLPENAGQTTDGSCPLASPFMKMVVDGVSRRCCFNTEDSAVWPLSCYPPSPKVKTTCEAFKSATPNFHVDIKRSVTMSIRPASQGGKDSDHETVKVENMALAATASNSEIADNMSTVPTRLYLPKYYSRPSFSNKTPKIYRFLVFAVVAALIYILSTILDISSEAELISLGKMRERDIEAALESGRQSHRSSATSEDLWGAEARRANQTQSFTLPDTQVAVLTPEGLPAESPQN